MLALYQTTVEIVSRRFMSLTERALTHTDLTYRPIRRLRLLLLRTAIHGKPRIVALNDNSFWTVGLAQLDEENNAANVLERQSFPVCQTKINFIFCGQLTARFNEYLCKLRTK